MCIRDRSSSLDELDVELAESEQFDGIALLQVLLDVVRIAVEQVFHTEDVVNVVLVELNLVTGHFVCFGHDS